MSTSQPPQQPPQWGPPPQGGPYYGPPPQPPQPKNGLGVTALVLGIIAFVFAFIPIVGIFLAIPLGILALIFGVIGMILAFRGKATNKGVAISGTTLAVAAFVLTGVMTAAVFGSGSGGVPSQPAAQPTPAAAGGGNGEDKAPDKAPKQNQPQAGIGDTVQDGKLAFTVTGVKETQTIGDPEFLGAEAQGKYVMVNLAVENVGDQVATFNAGPSQVAYDDRGTEYSVSQDAMMSGSDEDSASFLQEINPGNSVDGRLVFDVPEDTDLMRVHLQGGTFSPGVEVGLK